MRVCCFTGAKTGSGRTWSHTRKFVNGKSLRQFKVNLQYKTYFFPTIEKSFRLRLSTNAMKTIKKYSSIENLLLSKSKVLNLTPKLNKLKRDIIRKRASVQQIPTQ